MAVILGKISKNTFEVKEGHIRLTYHERLNKGVDILTRPWRTENILSKKGMMGKGKKWTK